MRARNSALFGALALALACAGTPKPAAPAVPQEEPPTYRLAVAASTDSVVRLAKFALGSVRGAVQPPQVQRDFILVSTEYSQNRPNGGHTQVTIIAAVHRKMTATTPAYTRVDLSAWGLDVEPTATRLAARPGARDNRDLPTLRTTSPAAMASSQRQPYRLTKSDSAWIAVEEILDAFIEFGNARLPRGTR